jgi:riboflavin synthase
VFTGLIEDVGTVEAVERTDEGARLRISTSLASQLSLGDSIAVDGCCLTATATTDDSFETEAMNQTLVVTVVAMEDDGFARRVQVELPQGLLRYVVAKGSITLAGVSLTVADLGVSWAEVSLIPETLERTNLGAAEPGRKINVECDIVAKYVERLVAPFAGKEQA